MSDLHEEFPLGYRHDLEDVAHLEATQRKTDAADLFKASLDRPIDESVREKLKGQVIIEGQARTSGCVGFSGSTLGEFNWNLEHGEWLQFSEMGTYRIAQIESGIAGDNGAHIDGLCRAGQKIGYGLKSIWTFNGSYQVNPPCGWDAYKADAAPRKLQSWKLMKSYADMAVWSQTGQGGFVMGIPWFTNWLNGLKGVMPAPNNQLYGFHAYPLLWSTKRMEGSRNYFEGPNSWMKTWSVGGWAEWSPSLIDWLLKYRGALIAGLSDLGDDNRRVRSIDWKGDSPWKMKG